MQKRSVRTLTVANAGLVMTMAFLAVISLATADQTDQEASTQTGVCCADQNESRIVSKKECLELGDEATWIPVATTTSTATTDPLEAAAEEIECGACAHGDNLTCRYTTAALCNASGELFCPDKTCVACLEQAVPDDDEKTECMMHRLFRNDSQVIDNMATFHALQERIVVESEKGREMKALFHEHMLELGLVLLRNPELTRRGAELLEVAAPGFRDLLGEPGGEALVLTPDRVRQVNDFLADVAEHASPEAKAALEQVQAEFEAVEGKSLQEIRTRFASR